VAERRAIAYGNDTDTTATVAGGLAGVYWAICGIRRDWLDGMRGRAIVEEGSLAFARLGTSEQSLREPSSNTKRAWSLRESRRRLKAALSALALPACPSLRGT
jgi:hypothetical protein